MNHHADYTWIQKSAGLYVKESSEAVPQYEASQTSFTLGVWLSPLQNHAGNIHTYTRVNRVIIFIC